MKTMEQEAKMQAEGRVRLCPRCGLDTMKPRLRTNALSRIADIYICDQCGMREALEDFLGKPVKVDDWACMMISED